MLVSLQVLSLFKAPARGKVYCGSEKIPQYLFEYLIPTFLLNHLLNIFFVQYVERLLLFSWNQDLYIDLYTDHVPYLLLILVKYGIMEAWV